MYGYGIPTYVKTLVKEWRGYDRFLRMRNSLDEPGKFILERKTRYLDDYPFVYGTDRQVQLKDEYRRVVVVEPRELQFVRDHLRITDIQRWGGAKRLAEVQRVAEENDRARQERSSQTVFEAAGDAAYEHIAWAEGRRVAGGWVSP